MDVARSRSATLTACRKCPPTGGGRDRRRAPQPRRRRPEEVQRRAARRDAACRGVGRRSRNVTRDLGVHKAALRTWARQAKADAAGGTPTVLPGTEGKELKRLRARFATCG